MSRADGFEDEQACMMIHSVGTALNAVVEVTSRWDGTVTFASSKTGSELLARLYEAIRMQELDQCMAQEVDWRRKGKAMVDDWRHQGRGHPNTIRACEDGKMHNPGAWTDGGREAGDHASASARQN